MIVKSSRTLLCVVPLFFITACATTPVKEIVIKTKPIEIEIAQPDRPSEIKLERPEWFVVNRENLSGFLDEVKKIQGDSPVFFAFTPQDYEKMSYNLQELRRYLLQQTEIIVYYEKMTAPKTAEKKSEEIRAELLEETVETVEDPVSPSWIPKLFRRN